MAYPVTDKDYLAKLELAASQKTKYWNEYPYNLGYYHSDGKFSFDCVNLNKAILNGWECIKEVGYFQRSLTRTGDCDEWGFISQCQYSTDFAKMDCIAALYMPGHIGNYIGKDVVKNGHTYNAIECTGAWGGGVVYSYVDKAGRRFNHKNGVQNGRWTHWGKMTKWLKYTEGDSMFTDVKPDDKHYKVYKTVCDFGLMGKDNKGRFRPKTKITRGTLAIVLYRMLKLMGKI